MKKRCYDHFCDVEVDTTLYGSLGFIPQLILSIFWKFLLYYTSATVQGGIMIIL